MVVIMPRRAGPVPHPRTPQIEHFFVILNWYSIVIIFCCAVLPPLPLSLRDRMCRQRWRLRLFLLQLLPLSTGPLQPPLLLLLWSQLMLLVSALLMSSSQRLQLLLRLMRMRRKYAFLRSIDAGVERAMVLPSIPRLRRLLWLRL